MAVILNFKNDDAYGAYGAYVHAPFFTQVLIIFCEDRGDASYDAF